MHPYSFRRNPASRRPSRLEWFRTLRTVPGALLVVLLATLFPTRAFAQSALSPVAVSAPSLSASGISEGQTDLGLPESSGGTTALATGSVDPSTGAFQASIPFQVPRARGAITPSLALEYSSHAGRGIGGVGWSLNLPSIERQNPSGAPKFTTDPAPGAKISLTPGVQDLFVYAGRALVPICFLPDDLPGCLPHNRDSNDLYETPPTWAMTGGWHYYRLEVEDGSNLRFFWSKDHKTWVIQDPSGGTTEMGRPQDDATDTAGLDLDPASQIPFRWNVVRKYDRQRSAAQVPTNPIVYKWAHFPVSVASPALGYLTDVFDTIKLGNVATALTQYAHHAHLSYIHDPTLNQPFSAPLWRARPELVLQGVDVTSQTFAGGAREQVRRYLLSYASTTLFRYELVQVALDGWCSSGNPTENPTTFLLPPEPKPGQTLCGTLPPTTLTYYENTPSLVSHLVPGVVAPRNATAVPLDMNADGLPDILITPPTTSPASTPATVWLNSPGSTPNTWTSVSLTLAHPALGATGAQMVPWLSEVAAGAFQNDSHVEFAWFDPNWSALNLATKTPYGYPYGTSANGYTGNIGVGYALYSPRFTSPTTMDWGTPQSETASSIVPTMENNCTYYQSSSQQFNICIGPWMFIGNDQKVTTVDIDGDGLQDLLLQSVYGNTWNGPPGSFDTYGAYPAYLNVRFTTRDLSGTTVPFATPTPPPAWTTPQELEVPNFCVGPRSDTQCFGGVALDAGVGNSFAAATNCGAISADRFASATGPSTFADVNADGIPDWIQMTSSAISAWFGHGDGVFGSCPDNSLSCPCESVRKSADHGTTGNSVSIAWNPVNALTPELNAQFHDLNGDGFDDIVVPTAVGFDVHFTLPAGEGGTDDAPADVLHFNANTAFGWPTFNTVVSNPSPYGDAPNIASYFFADMDGDGLDDVVMVVPQVGVGYVKAATARPGLLETIATPLGARTSLVYTDTATLSHAAVAAGQPWSRQSPQPVHVVTQVATTDATAGSASPPVVTNYTYRDPVYDARDRAFVGFTTVEAATVGDTTSPTTHVRTTFYQGYCDNSTSATCPTTPDYANHAERGLPVLTETFGDEVAVGQRADETRWSSFLSTVHREFNDYTTYSGLDGRNVHRPSVIQSDTYWDDNSGPSVTATVQVQLVDIAPAASLFSFLTTSTARHTVVRYDVDPFGTSFVSDDYGEVESDGVTSVDGIIHYSIQSQPVPLDTTDNWIWRPSTVTLQSGDPFNTMFVPRQSILSYDARGNPQTVTTPLTGTVPMVRATVASPGADGGAPPPTGSPSWASHDGTVTLAKYTMEPGGTGNVQRIEQPSTGRCQDIFYDGQFNELPTFTKVYPGGGCIGPSFTKTMQQYVRGLGLVTDRTDIDGEALHVNYDPWGRPLTIYRPDPVLPGAIEKTAGITFDYRDNEVPRKVHRLVANGSKTLESWSILDGFGREMWSASLADTTAGDPLPWIVSGAVLRNAKGQVTRAYLPSFQTDWSTDAPTLASAASRTATYDAFGRVTAAFDTDGTQTLSRVYGALASSEQDAEQLKPPGPNAPHAGQRSTTYLDGHGRVATVQRYGDGGYTGTTYTYLPTGELWIVDRTGTSDAEPAIMHTVRWMQYDSLGRMVLNAEPNTSVNFSQPVATKLGPTPAPASLKAWTYAYDDAGDLVATTDARGCGKNIAYDSAGRPLYEDYFPCETTQAPYSPPNPATGDGTEAYYVYDQSSMLMLLGHLTDVYDRGSHTHYGYDARSRVTSVQRNLAGLTLPAPPALAARYTPHTYEQDVAYDEFDRVQAETTGADLPDLLGPTAVSVNAVSSKSAVTLNYSARGVASSVGSSYGALISANVFDADGLPHSTTWADPAATQAVYGYDARRRPATATLLRTKTPLFWSTPTLAGSAYSAPPPLPGTTIQTSLENDTFTLDAVGNPLSIVDGRIRGEWPAVAQPVNRTMKYDDFYRTSSIAYQYAAPPSYQAPNVDDGSPSPMPRAAPSTRIGLETFSYDTFGSVVGSTDDEGMFFDRSLGTATVGRTTIGQFYNLTTNQLLSAQQWNGHSTGNLFAYYDAAGNLVGMTVYRDGLCASPNSCSQVYRYDWDEVGNLQEASRRDIPTPAAVNNTRADQYPFPALPPGSDHREYIDYAYGSDGTRVLRWYTDNTIAKLERNYTPAASAEIFPSLRLNQAEWDSVAEDYVRTDQSEAVYLAAGGSVLGRIAYAESDPTTQSSGATHVFLEMGDSLGSTSSIVDLATSELVERTTYTGYGQVESDYQSSRWQNFREDYKFTGKEEDSEVGLTYFGARYYSPYLQRWISPDPLAIHGVASDLNPYAYVYGRVTSAVDPFGLACAPETVCTPAGGEGGGSGAGVETGGGGFGNAIVQGWDDIKNALGHLFGGGDDHHGPTGPGPMNTPGPARSAAAAAGAPLGAPAGAPNGIPVDKVPFKAFPANDNGIPLEPNPTPPVVPLIIGGTEAVAGGVGLVVGAGSMYLLATHPGGISNFVHGQMDRVPADEGPEEGGAPTPASAGGGGEEPPNGPPGTSGDYRGRFNESLQAQGRPELPDSWDAHHRIPQEYRGNPEFEGFDFDSPENIRGVSGSRNPGFNVHQDITNEWSAFREGNPGATRAQIEGFAQRIDLKYGRTYW